MEDYQWPQPSLGSKSRYVKDRPAAERQKLTRKIESYFSGLFGAEVILVPSGRAAVAILLRHLGINRSHTVFTPKWTSTCLFDVIGRVSNPNTAYTDDCDVAIAVHKWGQVVKFSKPTRSYIVEDSVDSIITSPDAMFPNSGEVEIFSLPKIIGSYTGGLIAVRSKKNAGAIRAGIEEDRALARHQSKLRFDSVLRRDTGYDSWLHLESKNTSLDYNGLVHIEQCLPNYEKNSRCIQKRLNIVRDTFGKATVTPGRLPPVVALLKDEHSVSGKEEVMVRHYSGTGFIDEPDYREAYLVPLHFGVSDRQFSRILDAFRA